MKAACVRFAPMIGSLPGELAASDAEALARHLETCETCQALAADLAATDGLVKDGLLARANARDFSGFVDGVMARVDRAERPGLLGFLRRHRAAAAAGLVPVLAALAAIVYLRLEGGQGTAGTFELSSIGEATTVLQTADGPVVLLQADDDGT
jgi:anti-sigma factor RsiW